MNPQNINLNLDAKTLEQCLKSINHFGGVTYQNICSGIQTFVPWGELDRIGILLLLGLGFSVLIFLIILGFKTLFD